MTGFSLSIYKAKDPFFFILKIYLINKKNNLKQKDCIILRSNFLLSH